MKIKDIKTYILKAPLKEPFSSSSMYFDHRNSLLVKVITDEGIIGWGEAGQFGPPELPKTVIEEVLKPLLIDKNPFNTEKIWQDMYSYTRDYGQKGSVIEGISGIDIALWDIKGKALNLPVSTLLGGRYRDKVQAYATGLYFKDSYQLEDYVNEVGSYVEKGFKGVKIKIGSNSMEEDLKIISSIREKFGDSLLIMVDANHAYNANTAIRMGLKMEKYNIYWFEEPVIPEDIESYLEVKNALTTAVAGGECEFTQYGFKNFIKNRALDIAQPDICVAGGFTACRKIVDLANIFGIHVVPHVWGSAVSLFATLQLIATIPDLPPTNIPRAGVNQTLLEFDQSENLLREGFIKNKFQFKDGFVTIPDAPGIGVEIDENLMTQFII